MCAHAAGRDKWFAHLVLRDKCIEGRIARRVKAKAKVRLDVQVVLATVEVELLRVLLGRVLGIRREYDLDAATTEVDDSGGARRRRSIERVEQVVDGHPTIEPFVPPIEQRRPFAAEEEA